LNAFLQKPVEQRRLARMECELEIFHPFRTPFGERRYAYDAVKTAPQSLAPALTELRLSATAVLK
jgi:hypothetical protein